MTRLEEELEKVEATEDIFALFGLSYDPEVMKVHRLHIVKRFSLEVAEIDAVVPPVDDDDRWNRYAMALKRAHDYYAEGPPPGEHVFFGVQQGLVKLGGRTSRKG